jgi:gluconolactonase
MPLRRIELSEFRPIGPGIARPEDVVALRDGRVYASHHAGGVAEIAPDGGLRVIGGKAGAPNGINMDAEGRMIIANFGIYDGVAGPLERLDLTTGEREILVSAIGGRTLTSCNYPVIDRAGNIWCSHSTFAKTWPEALDRRADGFIFVYRPDGSSDILAEGLRFANGMALSADEQFLYCTQTSNADVLRFPILPGAKLGKAERYGPRLGIVFGMKVNPGLKLPSLITRYLGYTDGIGFDAEQNLWVTLPAAHKIVAITPAGKIFTIAHDPNGALLRSPTNISWGGADLRTLYVGDLAADYVLTAPSPVAGQEMLHHRV